MPASTHVPPRDGLARAETPASDADELAVALAAALAPWFRLHRREMSWRNTTDPYAIWVSEVMLQQTRVETVERYWGEFLRRFPDVGTLAAADEEHVLQAWSGLGYYRRARMLHRGAKVVAERWSARLPEDAQALRDIPGVGPYTAGAIAAIAFDKPVPLVDGNVARVLSRILAISDVREQAATARVHWTTVERIVQQGSPRVLAQALMELGATVCTPKSPRCEVCPVAGSCGAFGRGLVDVIPAVRVRAASPLHRWWALAIEHDGRTLLVRRPDEGLLAGLWCLPLVEKEQDGDDAAKAIAAAIDGRVTVERATGDPVVHTFTHRVWEMRPVIVRASAAVLPHGVEAERVVWLAPGEKPPGGLPSVTRKLLVRIGHGRAAK